MLNFSRLCFESGNILLLRKSKKQKQGKLRKRKIFLISVLKIDASTLLRIFLVFLYKYGHELATLKYLVPIKLQEL